MLHPFPASLPTPHAGNNVIAAASHRKCTDVFGNPENHKTPGVITAHFAGPDCPVAFERYRVMLAVSVSTVSPPVGQPLQAVERLPDFLPLTDTNLRAEGGIMMKLL